MPGPSLGMYAIKSVVRSKCNRYMNNRSFLVKENPKAFWSLVKSKTGKSSIPERLISDTSIFTNDAEISEASNRYFYSVFNSKNNEESVTMNSDNVEADLCDIQITENEVILF